MSWHVLTDRAARRAAARRPHARLLARALRNKDQCDLDRHLLPRNAGACVRACLHGGDSSATRRTAQDSARTTQYELARVVPRRGTSSSSSSGGHRAACAPSCAARAAAPPARRTRACPARRVCLADHPRCAPAAPRDAPRPACLPPAPRGLRYLRSSTQVPKALPPPDQAPAPRRIPRARAPLAVCVRLLACDARRPLLATPRMPSQVPKALPPPEQAPAPRRIPRARAPLAVCVRLLARDARRPLFATPRMPAARPARLAVLVPYFLRFSNSNSTRGEADSSAEAGTRAGAAS